MSLDPSLTAITEKRHIPPPSYAVCGAGNRRVFVRLGHGASPKSGDGGDSGGRPSVEQWVLGVIDPGQESAITQLETALAVVPKGHRRKSRMTTTFGAGDYAEWVRETHRPDDGCTLFGCTQEIDLPRQMANIRPYYPDPDGE